MIRCSIVAALGLASRALPTRGPRQWTGASVSDGSVRFPRKRSGITHWQAGAVCKYAGTSHCGCHAAGCRSNDAPPRLRSCNGAYSADCHRAPVVGSKRMAATKFGRRHRSNASRRNPAPPVLGAGGDNRREQL